MTPLQQAQALGQGIWHDSIDRQLLTSGKLQHLIDLGLTGLTSNPTIFQKAIGGSNDYDDDLRRLTREGRTAEECYEALAVADIQMACDLLRPVHDRAEGEDGYASIEVSAAAADDTAAILEEARRLHRLVARPNVLVKVPGTSGGIPAVRPLIAEGVNVNITLLFSLEKHQQVMRAYIEGLEDRLARGGDLRRSASVASLFLSRIDTRVDSMLESDVEEGRQSLQHLLGRAAIATAKVAYQNFKAAFLESSRFQALAAHGARVQRPLWASTGTKNPAYSDLHYVEPLFGAHTVNTMPPATIEALLDQGRVEPTLERDVLEARETLEALRRAGIDMEHVAARLVDEGFAAFMQSYRELLGDIRRKQEQLVADQSGMLARGQR